MENFNAEERQILLDVADISIRNGLSYGKPILIDIADYPMKLQAPGASFITLEIDGMLRGCIGSLEAYRPLVQDVANNAFAAAFEDSRFAPLQLEEFRHISKHISVLTKPELIHFTSEEDLLQQIRPGIDGLIFADKGRRGTFLPAVWESLPNAKIFLEHLKMKAGFPANYWSESVVVERYTTEVI